MADFVINEWLWADSSGSNGVRGQREAFELIEALASSADRIVVIEGSAFDRKAWKVCKAAEPMTAARIARAYVLRIRQSPERHLVLKPAQAATLPQDLGAAVHPDDRYLIQAQITVPGAVLVTTDERLRDVATEAGLIENCINNAMTCHSEGAFCPRNLLFLTHRHCIFYAGDHSCFSRKQFAKRYLQRPAE